MDFKYIKKISYDSITIDDSIIIGLVNESEESDKERIIKALQEGNYTNVEFDETISLNSNKYPRHDEAETRCLIMDILHEIIVGRKQVSLEPTHVLFIFGNDKEWTSISYLEKEG